MKDFLFTYCKQRVHWLLYLCMLYAGFSLLLNLINMACCLKNLSEQKERVVLIVGDLSRIAFYFLILMIGRISRFTQFLMLAVAPLVSSVAITEAYVYSGYHERALARVLATAGIFMLVMRYTVFNYLFTCAFFLLALVYPLLRTLSTLRATVGFTEYGLESIAIILVSGAVSSYSLRKFFVADVCTVCMFTELKEQWKRIINTWDNGVIIMSDTEEPELLYHNSSLLRLIEKLYPNYESITDVLSQLVVKVASNGIVIRKSFLSFLEDCPNSSETPESYFLDVPDMLVEIRVNTIIFDNKDTRLIFFVDCSSAQSLEKAQNTIKYKTLLISSISHELRTPVTAILGTLEIVQRFIPAESLKLLDMSKECCNMITAHINDLTVRLGES